MERYEAAKVMGSKPEQSLDVESGDFIETEPLIVNGTTILQSIDELPISIVYLGIGFLLAFLGWIFFLLIEAMAWVIKILEGVAFPLSIGCILMCHERLQHKIPPRLHEIEQQYGNYILAGAAGGTFMVTILVDSFIIFDGTDSIVWTFILFCKSALVFFILSRRFFQVVQTMKLKRELPRFQQQHILHAVLIVASLIAELASYPTVVHWYVLTSIAGAAFAIASAIDHCRRKYTKDS